MKRICSLLLIVLFSSGAVPQRSASLSGTVKDHTRAALPDQSFTLTNKATGEAHKAVSEGSGSFSFKDVAPGEYVLKAEAEGFKSTKLNVTIADEPLTNIKVKMQANLSDEVTISSKQSGPVSPENNTGSVYLNSESLNSLPSQDQNILSVKSNFLSPAAQGGALIAGAVKYSEPIGIMFHHAIMDAGKRDSASKSLALLAARNKAQCHLMQSLVEAQS
jgi:hypothetical protein